MMVLGIDPHKKSHTVVALEAATGELVAELTVAADRCGHERLIAWARRLTPERRFAIEDCRHFSGHLERALIAAGEGCVRVPPKLMAQTRRSARRRGKSDAIDAACVARAALREPGLPEARLAGPERTLRLLVDQRSDLVGERTRIQSRLRWHLHDLDLEVPPKALGRACWLTRPDGRHSTSTGQRQPSGHSRRRRPKRPQRPFGRCGRFGRYDIRSARGQRRHRLRRQRDSIDRTDDSPRFAGRPAPGVYPRPVSRDANARCYSTVMWSYVGENVLAFNASPGCQARTIHFPAYGSEVNARYLL